MRITVTLSTGQDLAGTLRDNPVATDLAARLPLTLSFRDFHQQEKLATLDTALTIQGVPAADAPEIGDIGYYAPSSSLVLYYDTVGRWPGLVRIGTLAIDPGELRQLPDGFTATFAKDTAAQEG